MQGISLITTPPVGRVIDRRTVGVAADKGRLFYCGVVNAESLAPIKVLNAEQKITDIYPLDHTSIYRCASWGYGDFRVHLRVSSSRCITHTCGDLLFCGLDDGNLGVYSISQQTKVSSPNTNTGKPVEGFSSYAGRTIVVWYNALREVFHGSTKEMLPVKIPSGKLILSVVMHSDIIFSAGIDKEIAVLYLQ